MKFFKRHKAFTLVEVLLAVLIFSVITASLYSAIHVGLRVVQEAKLKFEIFQELRICLRELQRDLRSVFYEPSIDLEFFEGAEDSFSVISYKTDGLYKITYHKDEDNLLRSLEKVYLDEVIGEKEIIEFLEPETYHLAGLIKKIEFNYLDTDDNWLEQWDNADVSPKAVKIGLYFVDVQSPEYKFQSIVSIPAVKSLSIIKDEE